MKVTVDIVLIQKTGKVTSILLVERGNEPYKGQWALPGGFVEEVETLEAAAQRELLEETGIRVFDLTQLYAFGDPARDPRGRTITVAFVGVLKNKQEVNAGDDAAKARWFEIDKLPALAFDHDRIIKIAREKREF